MLFRSRRKVILEQDIRPRERELSFRRLTEAMKETDPNIIDVGSLKDRGHNTEFLSAQIRKALDTGESGPDSPQQVVIILSPPFSSAGDSPKPIELETPTNARVYYLRRHVLPPMSPPGPIFSEQRMGRSRRVDPPVLATRAGYAEPYDSLDKVLKPLKPKTFDIYTPEDLRKAVASILQETSKM